MTAPTDEQLRTPQPDNPTFPINRERLRTLNLVDRRRVRRTDGGHDATTGAGHGSRIRVWDLWQAGLIVLAGDNYYRLTEFGRRHRQEAITQYDTQRAGSIPTTRPAPARHL